MAPMPPMTTMPTRMRTAAQVSEEEKSANEEAKKEFEDTCKYIKEKLGTKVGTNNNMHRNHHHRRKSQRRRRQQQQ